jgi:hypothetical protein
VVAKVRERIEVNKQRSQRFNMERFNLKKLNDVESKEQFCVQVSNRYAALEDLDNKTDCNNYRGISLLSTSYNILSNILLSRLVLYIAEIIGDHQYGF